MKEVFIATLLAASVAPAFAAPDGTLNFTGEVVASTCAFTGDANGVQTIALPKISTTSLNADGKTSGATTFNVKLTSCEASKKLSVVFDGVTNVDLSTGRMKNTFAGGATNVQVALLDGTSGDALKLPGGIASWQTTDASGNATFPIIAQYVATGGAATAGKVTAQTTFSVTYP